VWPPTANFIMFVPRWNRCHTRALTHTHARAHTHSLTHTNTHARAHSLTLSNTHKHTHARAHSPTHSHTHMRVRAHSLSLSLECALVFVLFSEQSKLKTTNDLTTQRTSVWSSKRKECLNFPH
jgi:hypothetical protein